MGVDQCTTTTLAPDASGTILKTEQCYHPLEWQVVLLLAMGVFFGAIVMGWKALKYRA